MGMYNEVFKSCPKCGESCEIQIGQIVPGFGGFNLDSPSSLKELTAEEITMLYESVKDEKFYCSKHGGFCINDSQERATKEALIKKYFFNS